MPSADPMAQIRESATALAALGERGPEPTRRAGPAGAVIDALRSALERLLRRQILHQQSVDVQTVQLLHQMAATLSTELTQLRAELRAELNAIQHRADGQAQTLDRLADRATVTESLLDELTAALPAPQSPT